MKKYSACTSILAGAGFCLMAATATADPIRIQADFTCPSIELVAHFGNYIAGLGTEHVLGQKNPVYFKTMYYPIGVPYNLNNYSSVSTSYNSTNAYVTCSYASTDSAEAPFDVSYFATNGYGGRIREQTNDTIYIIFPLGYHA